MSAEGAALSLALALCGAGALLAAAVPERRSPALLAWAGSLAALAALATAALVIVSGRTFRAELWNIRPFGPLGLSLDRLSALFLAVAAVVVLASSIYAAGYLGRYAGHYSLRSLTAWSLLLFACIVLILSAGDALLFLMAWEGMSVLSYLLVNFENGRGETSRAGYLMLAMGEAGFLAVLMAFLFLSAKAGSLDFAAWKAVWPSLGPTARWTVFLLTFFGFGVKAGLVPFNTWLPRAHPAAPANVSAILSGTILNLGLYGIVRLNLDLAPAAGAGPGVLVLAVGTISAFVGILYATTENDLKAMLAHSSIENVGIVAAGLGAGMVFTAGGREEAAFIAFVAAFYHMVNHSAYKSLLFLGAGAVDASAGTRDLNRLGGLIRAMPWTAAAFLAGSLAISALPPFNGFVSEWLTLQAMLRSAELPSTLVKLVFALCGAVLALTAALAVTCFVKAFAMGFLGMPRSDRALRAREADGWSVAPMLLLAGLCLLLGILPTYAIPALGRSLDPPIRADTAALVPPFFQSHPDHRQLPASFAAAFHDLGAQVGQGLLPGRGLVVLHRGGESNPVVFAMSTSWLFITLLALLALACAVFRIAFTRRRTLSRRTRWDGGIRRLLPEMTYTATGFSNPVRVIFDAVFRPTTVADTRDTVEEHFRTAIRRERVSVHVVDRFAIQPVKDGVLRLAQRLAAMHHGRINAYIAYVLLALLAALGAGLLLSS